jgi:CubicO group peptidase (beta-lactamase class C family)
MILVERGKLDLDRPANDYLGAAKLTARVGQAEGATLRRLASHTSGLPLHYQFFYEDEPYPKPSMDESIRRYGQLVTAPGEAYQYANFGYGVLDYVISRASGMEYAEFMRREVFLPLDMTRSSVGVGPNLAAYQAVRYGADQTPIPFYDFDHPGASAVYSSAHDLVRFGLFHLKQLQPGQKAILSHSAIDEMQRPIGEVGGGRRYGLGWFITPDEHGLRTISHSGGMGGVRTRLTLVPDEKIVVAALANAITSLPQRMTSEILAELLPDYGTRLRAETRKETPKKDAKPEFRPPDALIGDWQGNVDTYSGARPLEMQVKPAGDIHIRLAGQLKTLLNEARFDNGHLTGVFAGDIGTPDANRRPYHLHLRVKLRHDTLNGSLTAISLPGCRAGNALSHWVELKKQ